LGLAYRKLRQFEAERESISENCTEDFADGSSAAFNVLSLFPRHTLPLSLFERAPDEPRQVLAVLERLKDLRQQGVINDAELERLKKRVLDKMDGLRAGAV
jgi:hypothetical protein